MTGWGRWQVSIHEPARGVTQRLDVEGFHVFPIAWSPDGRSIAFTVDGDVYTLSADGAGAQELLAGEGPRRGVVSWSSAGDLVWVRPGRPLATGGVQDDIWVLPEGGGEALFFESDAHERDATFSPDGRWIAYVSNVSGSNQVYARPYPGPGSPTQLSSDRGVNPAWSPDGRRLYYVGSGSEGGSVLMGVDIALGDGLRPGRPFPVIEGWDFLIEPTAGYDVLADGSLLTAHLIEDESAWSKRIRATEIHVVLNWVEELKTRVPR